MSEENKIDFEYFKSDVFNAEAALTPQESKTERCALCRGNSSILFDLYELQRVNGLVMSDYDISKFTENQFGCIKCLKKGNFLIRHHTEGEEFYENGIEIGLTYSKYDTEEDILKKDSLEKSPKKIPVEYIQELLRTPRIKIWQNENWLYCCKDFMTFIGTWGPENFTNNSNKSTPSELFNSMCPDWAGNYEEFFLNNEQETVFYAFRCRHCWKLRGTVEFV